MKSTIFLCFKLFLFLLAITIIFPLKAQWMNVSSNPKQYIRHMSFPSVSIGYAIMDDTGTAKTKFYKTINVGDSWQEITLPSIFSTADIRDIHFPTNSVGYVAFRHFDPSLQAKIYRSTNTGQNWTDVSPPNLVLGTGIMNVHFVNEDSGFVFSGNTLYRTLNAGLSWTEDTFTMHGGPTEFDFNQNHRGIMGGWDGSFLYQGFIYYTADLGMNWDTLVLPSVQSQIYEVDITANNTAFALSGGSMSTGPTMYKTSNAGQNWDTINLPFVYDSLDQISDMLFVDHLLGFVCTNKGYIYKTINGGQAWTVDHFEQPALDVLAFNGRTVFCSGPLNTLLTLGLYSTIQENEERSDLLLYPNPLRNQGDIYFTKPVTGIVQLIDLSGKICESWNTHKSDKISLTSSLIPGLYYLQIQNEGQFKLMIE